MATDRMAGQRAVGVTTAVAAGTAVTTDRYWRSPGVWMAALAAALMFVNAGRAMADPAGFAAYLGLPLAGDPGFVHVYAVRALFLGLLATALVLRRQRDALALFAAIAVVMPVGDAILTGLAGAPPATVGRHAAIAVFLAVTALVLRRRPAR